MYELMYNFSCHILLYHFSNAMKLRIVHIKEN